MNQKVRKDQKLLRKRKRLTRLFWPKKKVPNLQEKSYGSKGKSFLLEKKREVPNQQKLMEKKVYGLILFIFKMIRDH